MSDDSAPVIRARGLTKRFAEATAVDGIDFAVGPGQCFGLLGPNGAGKTTTLRMLLGQTYPSAGVLQVLGEAMPAQRRAVRRRIGVVPQIDNLDPDFTVEENLTVYASYFGIPRGQAASWIEEILELVSLSERARSPIGTLSGGMKRRLSIARALVNDPELLILDEPTTGLDPQVRHLIWSRLRELGRRGKTLVLTTHYMEEAERLCDELIVMDGGRIVSQGSPRQLIEAYVESDVIEVRGPHESLDAFMDTLDGTLSEVRREMVEETLYCYTSLPSPLIDRLAGVEGVRFLHRPANLEDVFLRLTGRDLRD